MIERYRLVRIHDLVPRVRSKCDDCGARRLTTQLTLRAPSGRTLVEFLCNECLTKTPSWEDRRPG